MTFFAILWREWINFRNKFISITASAVVSPLLYLVAFGWGLGDSFLVNGMSYTAFVMPAIIAMNAAINGFSVIANDINMTRVYQKTFEAVMTSPIKMPVYCLARISAHVMRCLYGAALVIALSFIFKARLRLDAYFIIILILNCYVFSAAGFIAGILINTHADVAKISTFVITPMAFLCGTFFPLDKFPAAIRVVVSLLPLSQAVNALRYGFTRSGWVSPLVLAAYLTVLLFIAIAVCERAE